MIKQFTLSTAALLCFASQGFARHPFVSDPISNAPSVLVHTNAPAAAEVGADAAYSQDGSAPMVGDVDASMDASAGNVSSSPMMTSGSAPVYRYACPPRRQNNGLFGELMELERKKNAWLRRNFFGR